MVKYCPISNSTTFSEARHKVFLTVNLARLELLHNLQRVKESPKRYAMPLNFYWLMRHDQALPPFLQRNKSARLSPWLMNRPQRMGRIGHAPP